MEDQTVCQTNTMSIFNVECTCLSINNQNHSGSFISTLQEKQTERHRHQSELERDDFFFIIINLRYFPPYFESRFSSLCVMEGSKTEGSNGNRWPRPLASSLLRFP